MTHILLDPTAERAPAQRPRLQRPALASNPRVGLLDIGKARGNLFLARLEKLLSQRGWAVKHYRKPTFTRPAPIDLRQKIAAECELVIEALAD